MRENQGFTTICCLLAVLAIVKLWETQNETFIGDALLLIVGSGAAAILLLIAAFRAINRTYLPSSRRLFPLYLWSGLVFIIAAYNLWLNRHDLTLNFMSISSPSDFSMDGFDFKTDGRYVYRNGSGLGESRSYGTYNQRDSIITLSPESPRNAPAGTKLVIRPYSNLTTPSFNESSRVYALDGVGRTRKFDSGYHIVQLNFPGN